MTNLQPRSSEYYLKMVESNPALKTLLEPRFNKYIKINPTPKQKAFLWLQSMDAFYGGAAGGGKTVTLLSAALQWVDYPHYNAILFRDTYVNLSMPNSLMDLSFQWLSGTDARWSGDKKRWTFPSGATLSFGYLDNPRDHFNYQSAEFQFVGIDEAVNIRENQALYMFSRLRKAKESPVPIRFRCASNPPAGEQIATGEWVKRRYVDKRTREPGVIFIPAKMEDNPYLNQEEYVRSLNNLDSVTRKQLAEGDWEVRHKGKMFSREWFELVDRAPAEGQRIRYWDLAGTEATSEKDPCYSSGCKMVKDKNGIYYIESIIRFRKEPLHVEQIVRQTADMDGKGCTIYMEQEPGSSGKNTIDNYRRRILSEFAFYPDKVSGSKVERAMPLSSQAEAGNVKLVKGAWNRDFLDEIELFPEGKFLDQVDSASGAFSKCANGETFRVRVL